MNLDIFVKGELVSTCITAIMIIRSIQTLKAILI